MCCSYRKTTALHFKSVTVPKTWSNLNPMAPCVTFTRKNKRETWHSGFINCNIRALLSQRHSEEAVRRQTSTLHRGGNRNLRLECSILTRGVCSVLTLPLDRFSFRPSNHLSQSPRVTLLQQTNSQLRKNPWSHALWRAVPTHTQGRTDVKSDKETHMEKLALCTLTDHLANQTTCLDKWCTWRLVKSKVYTVWWME